MKKFIKFLFENFGPTLVFYGVNHFQGLKQAIGITALFTLADMLWKALRGVRVNSLFKFSAATTLIFGAVDLYSSQPFLLKYESAATTAITGLFFAASFLSERTVIEDLVLQKNPTLLTRPGLLPFLRAITAVWTTYFILKAAIYAWVAQRYTLEEALLIRSTYGTASLYLLIFASSVGGRPLFRVLYNQGWFKDKPSELLPRNISLAPRSS
jgi:uncharacterized membrane protein